MSNDSLTHSNPEQYRRGIFGDLANPEARIIHDDETLRHYVEALKTLGLEVVLTSGTFDLLHVGHMRYLETAKSYGDVLIVGVDSDEKVKIRKGPSRPVVPENERVEALAHQRSVDIITLKQPSDERWQLIKTVQPNTLILTDETYDMQTVALLEQYCGRIKILEPQATTSTSAQIRKLQIGWTEEIIDPIEDILSENGISEEVRRAIGSVVGRHYG